MAINISIAEDGYFSVTGELDGVFIAQLLLADQITALRHAVTQHKRTYETSVYVEPEEIAVYIDLDAPSYEQGG